MKFIKILILVAFVFNIPNTLPAAQTAPSVESAVNPSERIIHFIVKTNDPSLLHARTDYVNMNDFRTLGQIKKYLISHNGNVQSKDKIYSFDNVKLYENGALIVENDGIQAEDFYNRYHDSLLAVLTNEKIEPIDLSQEEQKKERYLKVYSPDFARYVHLDPEKFDDVGSIKEKLAEKLHVPVTNLEILLSNLTTLKKSVVSNNVDINDFIKMVEDSSGKPTSVISIEIKSKAPDAKYINEFFPYEN